MKSGLRATLVLGACLLLFAPLLPGQTTGTIEGTITDQGGGGLPGVTVEAASPNLQGTRTIITDKEGRYRLVSLPPGRYTVTATLSGMGSVQKAATVMLDATATVNLQLQLAAKEAITVTGEAPLVDTTSTTTGTSYTAKVIEKLPLGRNYASIVLSQPGVQQDFGETQGRSLAISIYGSTSSENLFLIDGVNTTNVIKGFQGKDINTEFIQEVEVKTGGYQAEYGRNTGGVINVITKSGGNEFHGDGFFYYNSPSFRSTQKFETTANYSQTGDALLTPGYIYNDIDRKDGGVDLGGYFWKDRIWFFGIYDRLKATQNIEPLSGAVANQNFGQEFLSNRYSGKLTFNIAQGTTLIASLFADPQVQTGAVLIPASTNPNTFVARRDTGGTDYAGRLNQLFGSFGLLSLQAAHHEDRFTTKPTADVPRVVDSTPSLVGKASVVSGGFGNVFGPTRNNQSNKNQYLGSFTAYVGSNEFKLGADYENPKTFGSTFRTGGQGIQILPCTQRGSSICDLTKAPFYTTPQGTSVQVFYAHSIYTPSGTDFTVLKEAPFNTPNKRIGAFAQDQWRILPTLTVNVGVRYDQEEVFKGNNETAFKLKNEWAPRAGFVWDFSRDGTSKLYGSYGRYYYAMPTDLNVRVFTANTGVTNYNYNPTDAGTQDPTAPRKRLVQVGSFDGEPTDPDIKAPYQDEYTIGVEKALDPTFSVGLKGTYRTLGRTIEDRCDLDYTSPLTQFNSCAIFNPGSGTPIANGALPGYNGSANPTDPTAGTVVPGTPVGPAKRIFRGIEFTARKAFSQQLWAQASYLYSTLRGNYSGAIREASGQTDPGINADYDYNQFLINAYGNLELDRPHQFRLDAVYNAPFGLAVGLQAYVRSGIPLSRQGYFNQSYSTELFLDPRGSNGRTPTEYDANISLGYNINIGRVTVTPSLSVFNLLNKQIVTDEDQRFNPNGYFVTNKNSPFYGQAGVEPGTAGPDGTICKQATPCSDNFDYRKATSRIDPRLLRAALKISF